MSDKEKLMYLIEKKLLLVESIKKEDLKDFDIALAAVKQNSIIALDKLCDEFKANREIAMEAVKNDAFALELLPLFQDDDQIAFEAVKQSGYILENVSQRLKDNDDFVQQALMDTPYAITYASCRIQNNKDLVKSLLKKNMYIFQGISENLKNDKDFLKDLVYEKIECLAIIEEKWFEDKEFILDFEKFFLIDEKNKKYNIKLFEAIKKCKREDSLSSKINNKSTNKSKIKI